MSLNKTFPRAVILSRPPGSWPPCQPWRALPFPHVHAAGDNTIQLALIGCGGRGNGAVANAMSAGGLVLGDSGGTERAQNSGAGGPIKLVAMADLRQDRLDQSHEALTRALGNQVDVPNERRFLGFDAYKKAIDCLKPGMSPC